MFNSLVGNDDDFLPPKKKPKKADQKKEEVEGEEEEEEEKIPYPKRADDFAKTHFGYERFSIHVSTDKQQYKPKEIMYIRGVLLNVHDHKPYFPKDPQDLQEMGNFKIKILNGSDESVFDGKLTHPEDSVLSVQWEIPEDASGGEYKVKIFTKDGKGGVNGERSVSVLKYTPPRFKKEIEFYQKGYSGGDTVKAVFKVERSEGGFCDPDKTDVEVTARLDGSEIFRKPHKLGANGKCIITFDLPKDIREGIGTLNVIVTEGVTETKSKSLPIILKKLDCTIYPEGGELICGIKNGVYAAAVTPNSDPADFEAILVATSIEDKVSKDLQKVVSLHEGRAYFQFVPEEKFQYHLRVVKPSGVCVPIDLPPAKNVGVGIFCEKKPLEYMRPINVEVMSSSQKKKKKNMYLGLFKKEKCISFASCEGDIVSLEPKKYDGVLRITLFQMKSKKKYVPIAERIVFVKPQRKSHFKVETKKKVYAPGDLVEVTVSGKLDPSTRIEDEKEEKMYACITVTDDSVIKEKEKRERAYRLPAMCFLENEVEELYDSDAYFNEDPDDLKKIHPDLKMDLLMGTQGWRRFMHEDVKKSIDEDENEDRMKRLFGVQYEPQAILIDHWGGFDRQLNMKMDDGIMLEGKMMMENNIVIGDMKEEVEEEEEKGVVEKPKEEAKPKPKPKPKKLEEKKKKMKEVKMGKKKGKKKMKKKEMKKKKRRRMKKEEEEEEDEDEDEDWDDEDDFMPEKVIEPTLPFCRIYAHQLREGRKPNERVDFTETLYYSPKVEMEKSKSSSLEYTTTFRFYLNDAVSSFCVIVDGFSSTGVIGMSNTEVISVQKPFYVEQKMPLELTFGDEIHLPIAIVSNLEQNLEVEVKASATDLEIVGGQIDKSLSPCDRIGEYVTMIVKETEHKEQEIIVEGVVKGMGMSDKVVKKVEVTPFGFPDYFNSGGFLNPDSSVKMEVPVPNELIPNSMETLSMVYPTPVGSMTKSLAGLISRPGGCFEQTSMTMYPMIMAVRYFKTHDDPSGEGQKLVEKANQFLESGYKRLIGYECKKGGYEWFGESPGHEALTSMGVMEFKDLSGIGFPVDEEMMNRTTKWLIGRLNKKKDGFQRNKRALDYFGSAPENTTDAYIAYACSRAEVPYKEIENVVLNLEKEALSKWKDDSYFVALVALILDNYGFRDRSKKVVEHLVSFQTAMGEIARSKASITNSRGSNLSVETTAVGILAFLRFKDEFMDNADTGVGFLNSKNRGGRFGSTQATVLALDAIIQYDEATAVVDAAGVLEMFVNDQLFSSVELKDGMKDAIVFDDFSKLLKMGEKNNLEIKMQGGSKMPYSVECSYFTPKPFSEEHQTLHYSVEMTKTELVEGDTTEVIVIVENKEEKGIPMTLARVSLPSGIKPRYDRLKELKKSGACSSFELFGAREVCFYFTCMKGKEVKKIVFDCTAEIPGTYRAQASQAYLYYDDDNVNYVDGLKCVIRPKGK